MVILIFSSEYWRLLIALYKSLHISCEKQIDAAKAYVDNGKDAEERRSKYRVHQVFILGIMCYLYFVTLIERYYAQLGRRIQPSNKYKADCI